MEKKSSYQIFLLYVILRKLCRNIRKKRKLLSLATDDAFFKRRQWLFIFIVLDRNERRGRR